MQKIKPLGEIAVAFAANSEFIPYTAVMIQSIIDRADEERLYDLVVLYSDIECELIERVISLAAGHHNISIRFFDVGGIVSGIKFFTKSVYTETKFSAEAYYRLLIPSLMPDYERVLYFDGDMIARCDVAELYDMPMPKDKLIAACRDYAGICYCYDGKSDRLQYRRDILGLSNTDGYVISGTLVFNIAEFNRRYSREELIALSASREWRQHDQDVLNVICNGKIEILPAEWGYVQKNPTMDKLPPELLAEYEAAEKNPKIVHFAGSRKPGGAHKLRFVDEFYAIAERTKIRVPSAK